MTQTVWLPWPPTVNALWRAKSGRNILSAPARAWAKQAEQELMIQRPRAVKGPVELLIRLSSPSGRTFDVDNRGKAPIDLLVRMGVIEDDNCHVVKKVTLELGSRPGVEITVTPYRQRTQREAA